MFCCFFKSHYNGEVSTIFNGLHLSPQVYWRPVFWGIGLQFLLGLLILRTKPGFIAFDWLGKQVQVSSSKENWVFWKRWLGV